MKKFVTVFLALLTLLTISACSAKKAAYNKRTRTFTSNVAEIRVTDTQYLPVNIKMLNGGEDTSTHTKINWKKEKYSGAVAAKVEMEVTNRAKKPAKVGSILSNIVQEIDQAGNSMQLVSLTGEPNNNFNEQLKHGESAETYLTVELNNTTDNITVPFFKEKTDKEPIARATIKLPKKVMLLDDSYYASVSSSSNSK